MEPEGIVRHPGTGSNWKLSLPGADGEGRVE